MNVSRHHLRQRATVRRSTDRLGHRRSSRASLYAPCRIAISTTTVRDIDLAPEKPQRRRRCPRAAAVDGAAEAEALVMLRPNPAGPPRGLRAYRADASARHSAQPSALASLRKIPVEDEQELMEFGVGQQRWYKDASFD